MKLHRWNEIPAEDLNNLVARKMIHTDSLTVARLHMRKGAIVPRHSHVNEQITTVESGRLRFIFDDAEITVAAGESLQIPSNLAHRVEALDDSVALDVFSPVREDWVRGEDAYLRGR